MKILRGPFLARLNEAAIGLAPKPTVEQSTAFVFKAGHLYTFNDEIMVRTESPLPFDAAVSPAELLGVLGRLPDDEIDIFLRGNELRIKGARRSAGIAAVTDIALPIDAVPAAGNWAKVGDGVPGALAQAARVCGKNEAQYLATCVHVTPALVEACDNYRMVRTDGATGFAERCLLPAASVEQIEGLELVKVAVGGGWVHWRTGAGAVVSMRCGAGAYHDGLDALLALEDPEALTLPTNLGEIIERAEVFLAGGDALVGVKIADNELVLTSRKEGGWYREKKRVRYAGRPLHFEINPRFLAEVLKHTRDVRVDDRRMALAYDRTRLVVSLTSKETAEDKETPEVIAGAGVTADEAAPFDPDDIPF